MDIATLKRHISELRSGEDSSITIDRETLLQLMEEVLQWRRSSIAKARRSAAAKQQAQKN